MNRFSHLFSVIIAIICLLSGILLGNLFMLPGNQLVLPHTITNTTENGKPGGSLVSPGSMIPSAGDSVIIADSDGKTLYKITRNGTVEWILDEKAAEPYGFWSIAGIGSDRNGNIYVSDSITSRIFKFGPDGVLEDTWGKPGTGQGEFDAPRGITVISPGEGDERICISDAGNNRVQVFNTSGRYIGGFSVPARVESLVNNQPPEPANVSPSRETRYVEPQPGANPRYVERTFDIQSAGETIPVSLQVDRSVYLGAQKINRNVQDIATKNPEDWAPVIATELADPTTSETIRSTLETLRYEGTSKKFDEREMVEFIAHFIQQIPLTDETENRYPVEVLHDKKGNSFDKALFLYGLLLQDGYDVVFLTYPGLSHAGVGIRLRDHITSDVYRTYKDSIGNEYLYINPDGPSFFGGLATTFKSSDPFAIHLLKTDQARLKSFTGYQYSLFVIESIIKLYEKYQFLVNEEKELKGDDAKKAKNNYQKIKSVLDYIEKNPSDTEAAYMRIKNSKVNDIIV